MIKSPCKAKPPPELGRPAGKGVPGAASRTNTDRGYDETLTMQAWEQFLTGMNDHGHLSVRHMIERSWSRSASSGVDARASATPLVADDDQLHQNRRQNRHLLAAADQTFQHAANLLEETSAMVVLTDREGVILDTRGDNRTLDAGHDIKLEPGGNWNEDVVGTNGIGTALSTGEPVFVHAAEHFCEGIKAWTCAGAPIRDPLDRSIVGLIDISGPPEIFLRHNFALSVLAAEQIELALGEQARAERLRLLEACLSSVPVGNGADGVVVL
ncbi:MAG: GAF domain-containing protein, partial [Geminicoccaceae bacterium]